MLKGEISLVPPEVLQKMEGLFRRIDRDNSGKITAADFTADEADIWEAVRGFFDYSQDGVVEESEFVAGFIADAWKTHPLDENFHTDPNYAKFNEHLLGLITHLDNTNAGANPEPDGTEAKEAETSDLIFAGQVGDLVCIKKQGSQFGNTGMWQVCCSSLCCRSIACLLCLTICIRIDPLCRFPFFCVIYITSALNRYR